MKFNYYLPPFRGGCSKTTAPLTKKKQSLEAAKTATQALLFW